MGFLGDSFEEGGGEGDISKLNASVVLRSKWHLLRFAFILVELLKKFLPIGYRQYHSFFCVCGFEDSYALGSKLAVIVHKHLTLRLTVNDRYSRMLSINL